MFGKILGFEEQRIFVENMQGVADTNYIGYHVVFPEQDHKIVGEIIGIDSNQITIQLIGEIIDDRFNTGVIKKPSMNTTARIIFKSELELILGVQDYQQKNVLLLGTSPIYKDYVVTTSLNDLFSNHFAILGNKGSGKSFGVTRLLQNVFFSNQKDIPKNAHIVLFDIYGEYYNTFDNMKGIDGLNFKKYTTQQEFGNTDLIQIPAYFLDVDDLAILLGAEDAAQVPILKHAIELVKIFKSSDNNAKAYIDNIIARTCLDIISSGKTPGQMRDRLISVLNEYNTPTLNLESMIHQPGYDRTFKQCLEIDDQGKINSLNLLIEFLQQKTSSETIEVKTDDQATYNLQDIYNALSFAIISEGYTSQAVQDRNNVLKCRLNNIINSSNAKYFDYSNYISKKDYIEEFFKTTDTSSNAQLVDVNLSELNEDFAKSLIKIFSKLFFSYTTELEKKGSYPIHILLEEAHRYVQEDEDNNVIGYNIFDRITKDGRKYGTILGFIAERPNELDKTVLSQCSNFIIFKLSYPDDLNVVKRISSNITDENINTIKSLRSGMGLVFGTAFNVPLLVNFPTPNPLPVSTNIRIDSAWYDDEVKDDVAEVTRVTGNNFVSTIDNEEEQNEDTSNEEENTTDM